MTQSKGNGDSIGERFRNAELITAALQRAVRKALREHKRAGNPICAWRNGKIVWIPAEEIPVDEPQNR